MTASTSVQAKTQWQPTIPPKQSIYEVSSTQKAPLGFRIVVGDRTFFYCENAATEIAAGKVVSTAAPQSNHSNMLCTGYTAAVGSYIVRPTLGGTALTQNEYAEGYLVVNDAAGEGHTYRIKSNKEQTTTTGVGYIELYDPIALKLTALSQVTLLKNKYKDVVIFTASSQVGVAIGVTPVVLTASYYGWLQTWGPCSVLCGTDGITAYTPVVPCAKVDGAVEDFDANGSLEQVIGFCPATGTATEYNPVWLRIKE